MIATVILILLMYRPLFWLGCYVYYNFYLKNNLIAESYLTKIENWLMTLWELIKPTS